MRFEDDLVELFESRGLGTYGVDLFETTGSEIPILASGEPTTNVVSTGGAGGLRTQNDVLRPAYLQPSGAVTVRADDYDVAYDKAQQLFDACTAVRNELIGSGWYLWIRPVQSTPYDFGVEDSSGQRRARFNVVARMKRGD